MEENEEGEPVEEMMERMRGRAEVYTHPKACRCTQVEVTRLGKIFKHVFTSVLSCRDAFKYSLHVEESRRD